MRVFLMDDFQIHSFLRRQYEEAQQPLHEIAL